MELAYEHLCESCNALLSTLAENPPWGDADDPEQPLMYAYDHSLLCGGRYCRGEFEEGDRVRLEDGEIGELARWWPDMGRFDFQLESKVESGLKPIKPDMIEEVLDD